jgi:hypothetical protein
VADDRQREVGVEQLDEAGRDRRRKHQEGGVDEPVHRTDPVPLEHARVEEGLLQQRHRPLAGVVAAVHGRLTEAYRRHDLLHRARRHGDGDSGEGQGHHDGEGLHGSPRLQHLPRGRQVLA